MVLRNVKVVVPNNAQIPIFLEVLAEDRRERVVSLAEEIDVHNDVCNINASI